MLQIKNISKKYVTGELTQTALDHVSLNLRDNEFVAILGPSGSGKTTLLNVIGGLDRYDDGDLIINSISTKKYKDRDWDSYRNHTIGFVFQSYNLIPHQTVLANVELALTISGISKAERKKRATQALEKVGLGNQLHKKPNQMSGGQMQRVAIARALVNNPDILLADEPTGALDSETSIQVMELLKEVAKDRLVVMVTHNPELAEEYATRIVRLKDGKIIDDSDPFDVDNSLMKKAVHQNMGKSSMSFLTSLGLSFNNLATKKARTILTAFAGSIGIIGIALILSLSNGVELYIKDIEEDTLSEYPIQILTNAIDLSSIVERNADHADNTDLISAEVIEIETVSTMLSTTKQNDLESLKTYLDTEEALEPYVNAIEYKYAVTPRIYQSKGDSYRVVNPSEFLSGFMSSASSSFASSYMSVFNQLPTHENLYKNQYDVKVGRWPENKNELVVVLGGNHTMTDFVSYALGIKDEKELNSMLEDYMAGKEVHSDSRYQIYNYDDILGIEFDLVNVADLYEYDSEYDLFVDKSSSDTYMKKLLKGSEKLKIVGVVMPNDNEGAAMLQSGICYTYDLTKYIIENAQKSEIVKKQLKTPEINVFTGKPFTEKANNGFDMSNLFTVNTDALNAMQGMTPPNIDFSDIQFTMPPMQMQPSEPVDLSSIFSKIKIDNEKAPAAVQNILNGYFAYAAKDPSTNFNNLGSGMSSYLQSSRARQIISSKLQGAISGTVTTMPAMDDMLTKLVDGFGEYIAENEITDVANTVANFNTYLQSGKAQAIINSYRDELNASLTNGIMSDQLTSEIMNALISDYNVYASENNLPQPSKIGESLQSYLASSEGSALLTKELGNVINMDEALGSLGGGMGDSMNAYNQAIEQGMNAMIQQMGNRISSAMAQMGNVFDPALFENMFQFNMEGEDFTALIRSMMSEEVVSYTSNLAKLNYSTIEKPESLSIYPKDFESKNGIIDLLNDYNKTVTKDGHEEKVITYTDIVGVLMNSVTNIIDTISYVLIAFVAISLVVSSIMIGIITYISVLERTKEIGILRAIGASKRNVAQVFNAETFLIGLLSGVLGILVSEILLVPANMLIHYISDNPNVNAVLPVAGAIILIIVAVLLTLTGGLIPASGAAKKDPVLALRSE